MRPQFAKLVLASNLLALAFAARAIASGEKSTARGAGLDAYRLQFVGRLVGSGGRIVRLSADGSLVVTASRNEVRVWRSADQKPLLSPIHLERIVEYAELRAGADVLCVATGREARIRNLPTKAESTPIRANATSITPIAFAPDGNHAVSRGESLHSLEVHDLADGKKISRFSTQGGACFCLFSPDSRCVLSQSWYGDHSLFHLWDAESGREVQPAIRTNFVSQPSIGDVGLFSRSGSRLAVPYAFGFCVVDVRSGHRIMQVDWEREDPRDLDWLALANDGKKVVAVQRDGSVRLWDVDRGKAASDRIPAHAGEWAASEDGTLFLCDDGAGEKPPALWRLFTGERIAEIGLLPAQTVGLSANGRLLGVGYERKRGSGYTELWKVEHRDE